MVWSGSLTPQPLAFALCFINNDCVTAEITYSTVRVPDEVLTLSRGPGLVMSYFVPYTCKSFTMKPLAATTLGLHWSGILVMLFEVMSWLCSEKAMATHSGTLAWRIPWTEELQPMGVTKSWTRLSNFTFTFHFHALEKEMQPTAVFLLGESQGRESLVGCRLWGRTDSDTTEAT